MVGLDNNQARDLASQNSIKAPVQIVLSKKKS